jgi:large subunit ribosomal protein L25
MLTLQANIRKISGKKVKQLRVQGIIPAVLYGPALKKPVNLQVDLKQFENVFNQAGETSLLSLEFGKDKVQTLIHAVCHDPVSGQPTHIDFYQPSLDEKMEAAVPLVFEGESLAVKELSGTLVRNMSEVPVRALPQDLPKEIRVDISKLKTLEDEILISDLQVLPDVELLRDSRDIVAVVAPPEKVEEELEKPIEEKVEEVEKVEKEKEQEPEEE